MAGNSPVAGPPAERGALRRIGILYHPKISRSEPLAAEIQSWLSQRGMNGWTESTGNDSAIVNCLEETDLLIVLGGDGSTLRAARLAADQAVPLFGVNLGRLGFLSEAGPHNWAERLSRVLAGDHWLERRLMLRAELRRGGKIIATCAALNDIVVSRGSQARVLRLRLYVDGVRVTGYVADGLIAATPTGSTAYAMAAGGPILPPELPNYLVVPVAPHLSLDRALVLHRDAVATIAVVTEHEAMMTADGQDAFGLAHGDEVVVRQNGAGCTFVRVENSGYFYRRLMQRLHFGIDF